MSESLHLVLNLDIHERGLTKLILRDLDRNIKLEPDALKRLERISHNLKVLDISHMKDIRESALAGLVKLV